MLNYFFLFARLTFFNVRQSTHGLAALSVSVSVYVLTPLGLALLVVGAATVADVLNGPTLQFS
jgi:hypothetical protein